MIKNTGIENNFDKAKVYFCEALKNFEEIDHWRGKFITLRDLHEIE